LDRRESEVLKMFFGMEGDKMTIEEIAKELDLESSQIRRIKIKAIEKLKKERGKNLKQFIIRSILIKKDIINNI
jgi:DNA-directed RNA polymerase sigma subunit (sigma70/sigma32)